MIGPNGLAFSPDCRQLYVTETGDQFAAQPERFICRYDLTDQNALVNPVGFARISPGYADGLAVDEQGNVWASAGDGVHCLAPDGALLGRISGPAVANLCFGGSSGSELFLCAGSQLLSVAVNVRGAAWAR